MADQMRTELVTDALTAAWRARGGYLQEAVFHSDYAEVLVKPRNIVRARSSTDVRIFLGLTL